MKRLSKSKTILSGIFKRGVLSGKHSGGDPNDGAMLDEYEIFENLRTWREANNVVAGDKNERNTASSVENKVGNNECSVKTINSFANGFNCTRKEEDFVDNYGSFGEDSVPLMLFSLSDKAADNESSSYGEFGIDTAIGVNVIDCNLEFVLGSNLSISKIQTHIALIIESMIKLLEMLKMIVENETPTVSSLEETQIEYNTKEKIIKYFDEIRNDDSKKIEYIEKISKNVILNIKEMIYGELLLGADHAKGELLYSLKLLSKLYTSCNEQLISDSILNLIDDILKDKDIIILTFKINQVKSALKYFNILNRFQEFNCKYMYNISDSHHNSVRDHNYGIKSEKSGEIHNISNHGSFISRNKLFNKVSRWHKQNSVEKLDNNNNIVNKEDQTQGNPNHSGHGIFHNILHHGHVHKGSAKLSGNTVASSERQRPLQPKLHDEVKEDLECGIPNSNECEGRLVEEVPAEEETNEGEVTETANDSEGWSVENSKGISISYKIDSMQNGQMSVNVKIKSQVRCKLIYLISILNEVELSYMWAPYMTSSKCIYNLSRVSKLVQQIYELPWPIGQRENIMYCFGIDALKEKDCVIISCGDPQTQDGKFFDIEIPEPPPKIQREKCNYLLFILTPSLEDRELITVELYSSFYVSKYVPAKLTIFLIKRMTKKMYTDIANLASNFRNTDFETAYNNNIQLYSWLERKLSLFYESKQKKEEY